MVEFVFRVAGEAGMGAATAADLLSAVALRFGYNIFSSKDYASQIRGGHNYHTIRVSNQKVNADVREINILLAFNQESLQKHLEFMSKDGIIIYNSKDECVEKDNLYLFPIDIEKIESELKEKNLLNFIFVGATLKTLGVKWDSIEEIIKQKFAKKTNLEIWKNAVLLGFNQAEKVYDLPDLNQNKNAQLISGNQAIALGALKAGLTFHAQYPMTPVTGILHHLTKEAINNNSLTVIQPEDEISAINMALGASYAGARAMTATSGGGFALMIESVSLAGMAEIPLVIVEGQRPGPATGVPTKTEQSDLKFVINAGHGDFPKVVIAPGSIEECYTETKRSFYLAEKYQLPVLVLIDKHLAESFNTVNLTDIEKDFVFDYDQHVNIIEMVSEKQLNKDGLFKRYASNESSRTIPGTKSGVYTCSGDEHDEVGQIIEDAEIRVKMMDRRMKKMNSILNELPDLEITGSDDAELTIISWGSNKGAIEEAVYLLNQEGKKVNFVIIKYLLPFQSKNVGNVLKRAKKLALIEGNYTAQLGQLITEQTGITFENKLLKFNGQTFTVEEIYREIIKWLN